MDDVKPPGTKVYIDGKEIPVEEWHLSGEADKFWGEPGSFYLSGLKDISGSFNGIFGDNGHMIFGSDDKPVDVYIYGPDPDLPWWKHWFYRIRERITGTSYPTVVLAHGPAKFSVNEDDGDGTVVTGTITNQGEWEINL